MRAGAIVVSLVAACVLLAACSDSGSSNPSPSADPITTSAAPSPSSSTSAPPEEVTVAAVGDIACDPTSPYFQGVPGFCEQEKVAKVLGQLVKNGASYFLPLGDNQYETGSYSAYMQVYDRYFGQFKAITWPVAGNHEWLTPGAAGYFKYFGARAGTAKKPWRTFKPVDGWQVLLLDSNCEFVGGCGPQSPQGRWIKKTLAKSDATCVVATWHHPLRTSGEYYGITDTTDRAAELWKSIVPGGVDLVLNGHDHLYERFRKFQGVQQFTVGTGGKNPNEITAHARGSQKVISGQYGVLQLDLMSNGTYDYAFHSVSGKVLDKGTQTCTNSPAR